MKMVYIALKDFDKRNIDVLLQKFMAMVETLINDARTTCYFTFHVKGKHHSEKKDLHRSFYFLLRKLGP